MLQRDVAGLAALGGEADADQLGADAVHRIGLGVERHQTLVEALRDPAVERDLVGHRLIGRPVDLRLRPHLALDRDGARLRRLYLRASVEIGEMRPESLLLQELAERRVGYALHRQIVQRLGQRRIADQPDQLAG